MTDANPLFDAFLAPLVARDAPLLLTPNDAASAGVDTLSGAEAMARTARLARAMRALGVAPGDRVAVQVEKSPEALLLYFACVAIGAALLPLNGAYTAAEVGYFVADAEPALLVCDPGSEAALAPIAAAAGARLTTLDASGRGALTEGPLGDARALRPTPRQSDDLAAILYTSGTTGRAKGAMLSHENLLSNARTLAALWEFGPADVLLHPLPIHHTHGLFVATNVTLAAGGAMIFLPRFDLDTVFRLMPRATAMMGVPTHYTRLLDDPRLDHGATAGMRLFVSGSAPLLAETHARFEARTGHRILERYGMTETGMIASNPYRGARRAGSVGPALPDVALRIADPESGAALGVGDVGVVEITGPNVFKGYWRNPEKTASEFRPDGYFITGDLGTLDAEGYLTIVGRAKDLIITGGFNVYPKEVELALDALPGVLESAVFGAPHPDFGEAVVAAVAPRPGATLDPAALIAALGSVLAKFKRPKRIVIVEALPRNAMGKVEKARLRADHAGLFEA